ncbi:MAG TPA: hypothetical protein VHF28_06500 [Nitrososphaera sp.]|nr:hypothetical protein [Nitrososphaera sp.]
MIRSPNQNGFITMSSSGLASAIRLQEARLERFLIARESPSH